MSSPRDYMFEKHTFEQFLKVVDCAIETEVAMEGIR